MIQFLIKYLWGCGILLVGDFSASFWAGWMQWCAVDVLHLRPLHCFSWPLCINYTLPGVFSGGWISYNACCRHTALLCAVCKHAMVLNPKYFYKDQLQSNELFAFLVLWMSLIFNITHPDRSTKLQAIVVVHYFRQRLIRACFPF